MRDYVRLQRLGESTLGERVTLLKAHHDQIETHIQHMQDYIVVLDHKITLYENTLLAREAEKGEETEP